MVWVTQAFFTANHVSVVLLSGRTDGYENTNAGYQRRVWMP